MVETCFGHMSILNPQYSELIEATGDDGAPELLDHIDYVIKKILNVKIKPRGAPARRGLQATIPQRPAAATMTQANIDSSFSLGGRDAERTFNPKPSNTLDTLDVIGTRGAQQSLNLDKA